MKTLSAALGTLLIGITLGGVARAQEPSPAPPASPADAPGFDLGVRLGFAMPFGNISSGSGNALSDGLSGAIPLVLEAGYRVNKNITVGALFQYGIALVKENMTTGCGGAVSCSGSVVRAGIQALYRLDVQGAFVPWLGLATGYEWFGLDVTAGGQSGSAGASGFEFATLQGGGEYRVAPKVTMGPFVSFSLGRYDTVHSEGGGMSMSMDIANKAMHQWLQFGARGTFNL